MKADFSEFTYGYAVTDDLINGRGMRVTVAPVFPSLIEEGWRGGGYDLRLDRPGAPLFLQFKLADRMVRRSAAEVKAGLFTVPFYRMHLRARKRSTQHDSLLELENRGQEVYYVAPAFHEKDELDRAYRERQVWNRSFRLRPGVIGPLLDDDYHHIAFQYPGTWILRSESEGKRGEAPTSGEIENRLLNRVSAPDTPAASVALERADADILGIVADRKDTVQEWASADLHAFIADLRPLERVAYFARRFFDCQLFLVQAK